MVSSLVVISAEGVSEDGAGAEYVSAGGVGFGDIMSDDGQFFSGYSAEGVSEDGAGAEYVSAGGVGFGDIMSDNGQFFSG